MEPVVRLEEVVREMDVFGDNYRAFLNIRTGELVTLSNEELVAAECGETMNYPDWQAELIQKAEEVISTDDYLELPSKFDIHEYAIVQKFCYTVEDGELQERLLRRIHGPGALRWWLIPLRLRQNTSRNKDNTWPSSTITQRSTGGRQRRPICSAIFGRRLPQSIK